VKLEEGKKIKSSICKPYLNPIIFRYPSFEDLLVNTYVRHEDDPDEYAIFIVINNEDAADPFGKYVKVSARLQSLDNFVSETIINDKYSVFKLFVPSGFKSDYDKLLKGKFSQLTKKYKNEIFESNNLMSGGTPDMNSRMYKILFRHPLYRQSLEEQLGVKIDENAELRDKPNLSETETFRYSDYE
jgi:hypothetical protein